MSKTFSKILCPIGFDQNSVAALKLAYELADPAKHALPSSRRVASEDRAEHS